MAERGTSDAPYQARGEEAEAAAGSLSVVIRSIVPRSFTEVKGRYQGSYADWGTRPRQTKQGVHSEDAGRSRNLVPASSPKSPLATSPPPARPHSHTLRMNL